MRIGEGMWTSAKKLLLTPSAITEAEIQSQTKDGSFHVLDEDYSESRLHQRRFVSASGYLLCTIPVRAVLAFMI